MQTSPWIGDYRDKQTAPFVTDTQRQTHTSFQTAVTQTLFGLHLGG